jgi:hypothetical protein
MKPNVQRWKWALLLIAAMGLMGAVGCENKPAEDPDAKATPMQLPTPPPQVAPGPPGQNSKAP